MGHRSGFRKKKFGVVLSMLLVMLILTTTLASAATLTLYQVQARHGALILYINVEGEISGSLNTQAHVLFDSYPVFCSFNETKDRLICRVQGNIYKHTDKTAKMTLDGQEIFFTIPEKPIRRQQFIPCNAFFDISGRSVANLVGICPS